MKKITKKKMVTSINKEVINKTKDYNILNKNFRNEDISPKELLDNILLGYAFCTCQLKENENGYCDRKNENFVKSSIIAIDIDNSMNSDDKEINTKKIKVTDDEYFSYETALKDEFIKEYASFIYTTCSHTEEWNRFRIVFVLTESIDNEEKYKNLFKELNYQFNGDNSTSASAQIFFGSHKAKYEFFGNKLDNFTVSSLINEFEITFTDKKIERIISDYDNDKFLKEDIEEIVQYIFKKGKISNERWWKVPTILKNLELFTDEEINQMINLAVGETGDLNVKLKHAYKYKDVLSLGTLIYYAKENGYELPERIINSSKNLIFWSVIDSESRNKNKTTVVFKHNLFYNFLINNGFRIFEHEKGYQLIKIDSNNHLEHFTDSKLRQFIIKFVDNSIKQNKKESSIIKEQLLKSLNNLLQINVPNLPLFNEDYETKLIKDTQETVYFFYKNGFRKIDTFFDNFFDYSQLNGYIWKKSILKRSYNKSDNDISVFEKFIKCVCSTKKEKGKVIFNEGKYESLKSVIGYLLSRYKNVTETIGIVLCDEIISDNPEGGTGKSLFTLALSKMRNVTVIDGRFFDSNSQFRFETVDESTEIINIDDCAKKFSFDKLFHAITGDITVEKKGISRFVIPFEKSPKLCFSTNHIFSGTGNSHERRIFEIEFSSYFNSKHRPIDEFKHKLFDEWNNKEWNRFDDFMVSCVQYYMTWGIVKYKQVNLEYKKLVENTSPQIAEYIDNFLEPDTIFCSNDLTDEINDKMKIRYSQTKITQAVHYWCETYHNYYFLKEFDRKEKNTYFVCSTDKTKTFKDFKNQENNSKENTENKNQENNSKENTENKNNASTLKNYIF